MHGGGVADVERPWSVLGVPNYLHEGHRNASPTL